MELLRTVLLALVICKGVFGALPNFGALTDTGTVAEDEAIGTTISLTALTTALSGPPTAITILDTSTPDGAETLFSVALSGAPADDFILTTAATLDRETVVTYTLQVRATNGEGNSGDDGSGDLVITLTVSDVNDNSPVFNPVYQCVQMAVGTVATTEVGTVTATDADDTANTMHATPYALSAASTVYEVHDTTGVVTVSSGQTLAAADAVTLMITGKDKGTNTATATLKVCLEDACCEGGAGFISGTVLAIMLSLLSQFM